MSKPIQKCTACDFPMFPVVAVSDTIFSCPFCRSETHYTRIPYCADCKVVYQIGCAHNSDINTHNAMIMTGFSENGINYDGMLQFNDDESANRFQDAVASGKTKVYFICTCKGYSETCVKSSGEVSECDKKTD